MKNTLLPMKDYHLGEKAGVTNGVTIYPSTLRDILLKGQNELGTHHYTTPYLLQAINVTFKKLMKQGKWVFVVKRDIYQPNNIAVKKIIKCFPRFAVAQVTIRNGSDIQDDEILDDINYAELLDQYNHAQLYIFDPKKHLKTHINSLY